MHALLWDGAASVRRRGGDGAGDVADGERRSIASATEAGVAAEARAQKKYSKYREACARIDCTFKDGVIERYGHCSGGLVGLVLEP